MQSVYATAHPVTRIGGLRPSAYLGLANSAGVIAALLHLVFEEIAIPRIGVKTVLAVIAVLVRRALAQRRSALTSGAMRVPAG